MVVGVLVRLRRNFARSAMVADVFDIAGFDYEEFEVGRPAKANDCVVPAIYRD
jgi:hypothetical protein